MKRILLPTDFSKNSINAIHYAMELFEKRSCEFFLLNIQKPSQYITEELMRSTPTDSVYEAVSQDNKKQLEDLKESLMETYVNRPYHFKTVFDFDILEDAIQQLVNAETIELVIMGTNGATDAAEVIFGSNTLRVIRNVHCPILAIPENYKYHGFSSLLFSLMHEEHFHPEVLTPLSDLLRDHVVSLEVLQIDTHEELPESPILSQFAAINYHPVESIPAAHAISSYEQLLPVDMHAIYIKPKSFFQRLFSGNDTAKLSYISKVPLLVLK